MSCNGAVDRRFEQRQAAIERPQQCIGTDGDSIELQPCVTVVIDTAKAATPQARRIVRHQEQADAGALIDGARSTSRNDEPIGVGAIFRIAFGSRYLETAGGAGSARGYVTQAESRTGFCEGRRDLYLAGCYAIQHTANGAARSLREKSRSEDA